MKFILCESIASQEYPVSKALGDWDPRCTIERVSTSSALIRQIQLESYDLVIMRHNPTGTWIQDLKKISGAPPSVVLLNEDDGVEIAARLARSGLRHLVSFEEASNPSRLCDALEEILLDIHQEECVKSEGHHQTLAVLAGGMAHDINNMLAVIVGNASLLGDFQVPGSEEEILCDSILSASDKLTDLGKKLLAFSDGDRFFPQPLSLDSLIEDSLTSLMETHPDISIEPVLADDLFPIDGDLGQMNQLLSNLLQNALEAMPQGGTLRVSLECAWHRSKDGNGNQEAIQLMISDNGCGMTPEQSHRALEPFYSTKAAGRGLGLAVVAGIMRNHGGHISIHSQCGQGTKVSLTFPASNTSASSRENPRVHGEFSGWAVL